jgi:hypothetical protein
VCGRLSEQTGRTQDALARLDAALPPGLADRLHDGAAALDRVCASLRGQVDGLADQTRAQEAVLTALLAAQDRPPGIAADVLERSVAGLAGAAGRLRAELDSARTTLDTGVNGLLSAASLLRRDAADTSAAAARREAEGEAAQAARLGRVEDAALRAVARLADAAAARPGTDGHGALDDAALASAMDGMLAQLGAVSAATDSASAWLTALLAEGRGGGRKLSDLRSAAAQIAGATVKLNEAGARQDQAAIAVAKAASAVVAAVQTPLTVLGSVREA